MPLISRVGRKSPAVRLLVAVIYMILTAGAVTMVYPFLIMISGSVKTDVDQHDFDIFPAYVHNTEVLFRKHLECKYNNLLTKYCAANRVRVYEFGAIDPPGRVEPRRVADWQEFEAACDPPPGWYNLGYMKHTGDRLMLRKHREFRARLMELCGGSVEEFRRRFDVSVESWTAVGTFVEQLTERRYQLSGTEFENEFYRFKAEQPAWFRFYPSLDGMYVQTYLEAIYGRDIKEYNRKHGTDWTSYGDIVLSATAPEEELERSEWEHFVREEINLQFIRVGPEARFLFAIFLRERYAGDISLLNRSYGSCFTALDDVTCPEDLMHWSERLVDWAEFVRKVPAEYLSLTGPEIEFREFLRRKYNADLSALNCAHNAGYASFDTVPMPTREVDYAGFLANRREIRSEFLTANYKQVIDYVFLHGRGLMNTAIYCLLGVLLALAVNPMAAYALSRYKLANRYKILLFFMATMAFPPAVAMIPNFLLLKKLSLLNTFAALVLPGAANGFSIFLLKGFFDSLPRELYESAELDGANEWVMFWHLTMALSKPILAVLALTAFKVAYGNFMFAFILCPDEKMWTLMVFLYQLQIGGHTGLTFAALLVAAVPTFLVFVFCQNIIIRGIVVPVEK